VRDVVRFVQNRSIALARAGLAAEPIVPAERQTLHAKAAACTLPHGCNEKEHPGKVSRIAADAERAPHSVFFPATTGEFR
jgi:hypothetical protein